MNRVSATNTSAARRRRRTTAAIKESLRELRNELSLLNHRVGAKVALKDVDIDCLELVQRHGPLSPTALARRAGLHPATMTGILDRLERGGWVVRERDPEAADRRAVTVRALPDRNRELFDLYSAMNRSMDHVCAEYAEPELEIIRDFLRRTAAAGRHATEQLTTDD